MTDKKKKNRLNSQTAKDFFKRLIEVKQKEPNITLGVDIGATSIKVLALGPRKGSGARPIIGQHLTILDENQGVDASEAIKAAVASLQITVRAANVGVSGQWVIMRAVEMPIMSRDEIMQALPFEAQRYLPFNISEVTIDGAVLGPSDKGKVWVLIIACKKELLERKVDWVRHAGLDTQLVDVEALALTNGFLSATPERETEGTRAIIDVGAQVTNLVVFLGRIPYLVRDIPWAGDKLLRHMSEHLGLDVSMIAKSLTQGEVSPEVAGAMKPGSEALVNELQLSFDYFENRFGQPPEEILVCGGLGQCEVFVDALRSHFTQTVRSWTPVPGLSGQFAVAYGLALRQG